MYRMINKYLNVWCDQQIPECMVWSTDTWMYGLINRCLHVWCDQQIPECMVWSTDTWMYGECMLNRYLNAWCDLECSDVHVVCRLVGRQGSHCDHFVLHVSTEEIHEGQLCIWLIRPTWMTHVRINKLIFIEWMNERMQKVKIIINQSINHKLKYEALKDDTLYKREFTENWT